MKPIAEGRIPDQPPRTTAEIPAYLDAFTNYRNLTVLQRFLTSPALLEFFIGCLAAHVVSLGWRRHGITALVLGIATIALGLYIKRSVDWDVKVLFYQPLFGGGENRPSVVLDQDDAGLVAAVESNEHGSPN